MNNYINWEWSILFIVVFLFVIYKIFFTKRGEHFLNEQDIIQKDLDKIRWKAEGRIDHDMWW